MTADLDKQILEELLANHPKRIALDADPDGNLIIDAEKHPDLYNWVVEG
jgi:hypothetical protein